MRTAVVLQHHETVSAVERVVQLVRTGEGFAVHGLEDLEALLIDRFLGIEHSLHEVHLVHERGVRVRLEVRFQVAHQRLVAHLKTLRQRIIALLHLRGLRLGWRN